MTRSVASNLKIDPSGPVAVFDLSKSSQHFKEIVLTCTSTENLNITWEIPTFNFAELNKRSVSVRYLFSYDAAVYNIAKNTKPIILFHNRNSLLFGRKVKQKMIFIEELKSVPVQIRTKMDSHRS